VPRAGIKPAVSGLEDPGRLSGRGGNGAPEWSRTTTRLIRSQTTMSDGGGKLEPQTGLEPALDCLKGSGPSLDDCGDMVGRQGIEPCSVLFVREVFSPEN
jgi:hypothetical protein